MNLLLSAFGKRFKKFVQAFFFAASSIFKNLGSPNPGSCSISETFSTTFFVITADMTAVRGLTFAVRFNPQCTLATGRSVKSKLEETQGILGYKHFKTVAAGAR